MHPQVIIFLPFFSYRGRGETDYKCFIFPPVKGTFITLNGKQLKANEVFKLLIKFKGLQDSIRWLFEWGHSLGYVIGGNA